MRAAIGPQGSRVRENRNRTPNTTARLLVGRHRKPGEAICGRAERSHQRRSMRSRMIGSVSAGLPTILHVRLWVGRHRNRRFSITPVVNRGCRSRQACLPLATTACGIIKGAPKTDRIRESRFAILRRSLLVLNPTDSLDRLRRRKGTFLDSRPGVYLARSDRNRIRAAGLGLTPRYYLRPTRIHACSGILGQLHLLR